MLTRASEKSCLSLILLVALRANANVNANMMSKRLASFALTESMYICGGGIRLIIMALVCVRHMHLLLYNGKFAQSRCSESP